MIKQLEQIVGKQNIKTNYPLNRSCSYQIGGPAKYLLTPQDYNSLFNIISFAKNNCIKLKIIGNASNILFSDNGFDGIVVTTKKLNTFSKIDGSTYLVGAGVFLSKVVQESLIDGLRGLEFSVGIPATVGGAVVMNAGAFGSDMSQVVQGACIYEDGQIKYLTNTELDFSYRSSYFKTHNDAVVLFVELKLTKAPKIEIQRKIEEFIQKRKTSQPPERSAGSVFKKHGEIPAGKLIDQAGLKGTVKGGAKISDIHANFIVNHNGTATAKDVLWLIQKARQTVYEKFGKWLELEIEII